MQSLAETAAKLVRVHYVKPASLGKPLLTIQQAIQADSFYDLSRAGCSLSTRCTLCHQQVWNSCLSFDQSVRCLLEPMCPLRRVATSFSVLTDWTCPAPVEKDARALQSC